jgi:hypothetical protein
MLIHSKWFFFTKHDIKKNTKLCKREIFFMPFFKSLAMMQIKTNV